MNSETFEPIEVDCERMKELSWFLIAGEVYRLVIWNGKVLEVKLPPKVDLLVSESSEGVKGDTVSGATKTVKLETGLEVKVPLFVKQGDKLRINVENQQYVERVND